MEKEINVRMTGQGSMKKVLNNILNKRVAVAVAVTYVSILIFKFS